MNILDRIRRKAARALTGGSSEALRRVAASYKRRGSKSPARAMLSVVLGSYNRRPFLEAAIESVRNSTIPVLHEIIVVDGGSVDGSIEWLTQQKDVVTIVQHNSGEFRGAPVRRRSWGYFMNLAFKAAQGDWILMISDDCLVLDRAIHHSVVLAEKLKHSGRKIGGVAYYYRNWPQEAKYYVQETAGGLLMVNHGLFSREALEQVGYANEDDYMFYKADSDLSLRIWHAGYEIVPCDHALVEHFCDEMEAVRQTNNALMIKDRNVFSLRWGHLDGMSRKRQTDNVEPTQAAERVFGPLLAKSRTDNA